MRHPTRRRIAAGLTAASLALAPCLWPAAAVAQVMPTVAPGTILAPDRLPSSMGPWGRFVVLRVTSRVASTGTRSTASTEVFFEESVPVPPCTVFVIPVLSGHELGYGTLVGDASRGTDFSWGPDERDRWFGRGRIDLWVDGFEGADADRRVRVRARAVLSDKDGADRWWGVVRYQLLFIGPEPVSISPPICR
jgi:hypothetical protein